MLAIFADWIVRIYKSIYYPHDLFSDFNVIDSAYQQITGMDSFQAVSHTIMTLGISVMVIYFFMDLVEKSVSKMLSLQQLFLSFLKLIFAALLICYSPKLMDGMMEFGNALADTMVLSASGTETLWFDQTSTHFGSNWDNMDILRFNLSSLKLLSQIGYVIQLFVPYIIAAATEVVFYLIMISRIVELAVRFLMAPIALGDAFNDTRHSVAINYLKKILALCLQFAVALGICISVNLIIQGLSNGIPDAAQSFSHVVMSDRGAMEAKDPDTVKYFLDCLLGGENYWLFLGLGLTKILLLFKSQAMANDIVGV